MIAALAILLSLVWLVSVLALGVARELHHFYYGLALLLVPVPWVQWVGLAIMADDAVQHAIQLHDPSYRSPLHLLYRYTLWQWLVRR